MEKEERGPTLPYTPYLEFVSKTCYPTKSFTSNTSIPSFYFYFFQTKGRDTSGNGRHLMDKSEYTFSLFESTTNSVTKKKNNNKKFPPLPQPLIPLKLQDDGLDQD